MTKATGWVTNVDRRNEHYIIKLPASKSIRRLFSELPTVINIIENYGDTLKLL